MNIKEKILAKGFTLSGVARQLGITQPTLSNTIKGNPSLGTLQKIADVIGMSVSELVSDELPTVCPYCGRVLTIKNEIMAKEERLVDKPVLKKISREEVKSFARENNLDEAQTAALMKKFGF